jgi:hypothetical protein
MVSIQIDITDIHDLKIAQNSRTLASLKDACESILNQGGHVFIKRTYENAPDELIRGFNSTEQFTQWWKQAVA